jgi:isoamylase
LIAFTQSHPLFQREYFWTTSPQRNSPTLTWHGVHLAQPDWSDDSHSLAVSLHDATRDEYLHIIFNAYWEPLVFDLPPLPPERRWHRLIDTALPSPDDFTPLDRSPALHEHRYRAASRSVVVLCAQGVIENR